MTATVSPPGSPRSERTPQAQANEQRPTSAKEAPSSSPSSSPKMTRARVSSIPMPMEAPYSSTSSSAHRPRSVSLTLSSSASSIPPKRAPLPVVPALPLLSSPLANSSSFTYGSTAFPSATVSSTSSSSCSSSSSSSSFSSAPVSARKAVSQKEFYLQKKLKAAQRENEKQKRRGRALVVRAFQILALLVGTYLFFALAGEIRQLREETAQFRQEFSVVKTELAAYRWAVASIKEEMIAHEKHVSEMTNAMFSELSMLQNSLKQTPELIQQGISSVLSSIAFLRDNHLPQVMSSVEALSNEIQNMSPWEIDHPHEKIELLPRQTLHYLASKTWSSAVGNRLLHSGVHYWEVKLLQMTSGSIMLGVCLPSFDLGSVNSVRPGQKPGSIGFYSWDGDIYLAKKQATKAVDPWAEETVVGVMMDYSEGDKGTLSLWIKGEPVGSVGNVPKGVYPLFSFYALDTKIQVVPVASPPDLTSSQYLALKASPNAQFVV